MKTNNLVSPYISPHAAVHVDEEWAYTDETNCIFLSLFIHSSFYLHFIEFHFYGWDRNGKEKCFGMKKNEIKSSSKHKLMNWENCFCFFSSIIFSFSSFLFPIFVFLLIYFHFSLPFFTLSIKRWGRVRKKMLLNCTNPLQLLVYSYIKVHLTPILFSSFFIYFSFILF